MALESSLQNQVIAMFICNLAAFSLGSAMGWLSPVMGALAAEGGPLREPLSEAQVALCGSAVCAGAFLGLPLFGWLARARGRKAAAYATGVPLVAGFLLKLTTDRAPLLLLARFLCGVGGAGANGLPPLYAAECVETRARGALAALQVVMFGTGMLAAYGLGALLTYRALAAALLAPPLLFLLGFWFLPETPAFRMRRGQEEEAARALAWLRRWPLNGPEVRAELAGLAREVGVADAGSKGPELEALTGAAPAPPPWRRALRSAGTRRALGLCALLVLAQTTMGMFAVSTYAATVLQQAVPSLDGATCSVLYALAMLAGSLACSLLVERLGRRRLQLWSCAAVGVGEAALAWSLGGGGAPWLGPCALSLAVLAFNAGAGSMPFVVVGEVFAVEVREACSLAVLMQMWLCSWALLQSFPWCVARWGLAPVFYFFSGAALVSGVVFWRVMPETSGRSLVEIEELFAGRSPAPATPPAKCP